MKLDQLQLAAHAQSFGVPLSAAQLAAFARFAAELLRWNSKSNLTAITNPQDILLKHFVDSLALVPLLRGEEKLLDVGSGAGFPAIPVKIAMPGVEIVTVDAVQKKILFQRHIIRTLALSGMQAVHARVEEMAATSAGAFDVIVSRAFTALGDFIRLTLPLLADNGMIIAMKGKEGRGEAAALDFASYGVRLVDIREFSLPQGAGDRSLLILKREY